MDSQEGRLPGRLSMLFSGLLLSSIGVAFMLASGFGVGPWAALTQGTAGHLGLSFGTARIALALVAALLGALLAVRPGLGTVTEAVLTGVVIDALLRLFESLAVDELALAIRAAATLGGIAAIALGSACYLAAGLGVGSREAIMLGLTHRAGVSIVLSRATVESTALLAALALAGPVGIGTLAVAALVPPILRWSLPALHRRPHQRTGAAGRASERVRVAEPPPRASRLTASHAGLPARFTTRKLVNVDREALERPAPQPRL